MPNDPIVNRQAARYIPVARPTLGRQEAAAVERVVASGWISAGEEVARFEEEFAATHDFQFGVACNSGTTALTLAIASRFPRGFTINGRAPRIACPTLTMVACANAILHCGGRPVFVDSEPASGNMDPSALYRLIDNRDVGAVLAVHLYGEQIRDRDLLRSLAKHRHIEWIEDCAEAHYAWSGPRPIGAGSDLACFSFYANKICTTGEGGMVLTDDPIAADKLRRLRAHAFSDSEHFVHTQLAYGARMTDLQAAVGRVQHRRRDEFVRRRTAIAVRYAARFASARKFRIPHRSDGAADWVFPLICGSAGLKEHIREKLAAAGIETRSFFVPMHRQEHLKQWAHCTYPIADELSRCGFYLPLYPTLSDDDIDYICDALLAV